MNRQAPLSLSSIPAIRGREYRCLTLTELRTELSTHSRRPPSFFFANNLGSAADDDDRWMTPFARFVSKYALRVRSANSKKL